MIERTETGYRLRCVCEESDCTAALEVEVYPGQDVVLLSVEPTTELPFRLSELREALAEPPAREPEVAPMTVRVVGDLLGAIRSYVASKVRDSVALPEAEPRCQEPTCPDFGDPDFGEGTCPSEHADFRPEVSASPATPAPDLSSVRGSGSTDPAEECCDHAGLHGMFHNRSCPAWIAWDAERKSWRVVHLIRDTDTTCCCSRDVADLPAGELTTLSPDAVTCGGAGTSTGDDA